MDLLLDYSSCPAMISFPLSLSSFTPCAATQLYLVLPKAASGDKMCFLRDPVTLIPPSSSPPVVSSILHFLDKFHLWRVVPGPFDN